MCVCFTGIGLKLKNTHFRDLKKVLFFYILCTDGVKTQIVLNKTVNLNPLTQSQPPLYLLMLYLYAILVCVQ